MSAIIITLYFVIVVIFLSFGATIVFHLLHYKINRRVSGMISLIYIIGAALLLISNFILFQQVAWNQIFSIFKL
ncbi:MAG: hypothetical protein WC643_01730 [Parcubacteria group bacterium]|jgi:hypothetical protein